MKMKVSSVAFAMLLAPAILIAETISVTFDAALTNETGWVYDTGFEYVSTQKKYGFKSVNNNLDQIISPLFDFAVTSVVINAEKASNKTTRKMSIRATSGNAAHNAVELVDGIIPPDQVSFTITNIWDKSDAVHSFSLLTTGGSGNLYLTGAVISGVLIIDAPTNLQADDIKGTRFRLSWTNPENAVSNKIEVSEIVETETSGGSILEYDFNEFTNSSGQASNITEKFTNSIPAFTGSSVVKLPAYTDGIIQISDGNGKGFLVHSGFQDCSKLSVTISLKVPTDRQSKDFGIGYEDSAGQTNEFPLISMSTNFVTHTFSLATLPANTPLIFNTHGNGTKRIVYIDYLAFVNGNPPTSISTNLVKTAFVADSTTYSVRGLCPRTEYVARITAFDADGNESSPSEPLLVSTTGTELPFTVRIR